MNILFSYLGQIKKAATFVETCTLHVIVVSIVNASVQLGNPPHGNNDLFIGNRRHIPGREYLLAHSFAREST